MVRSPCWVVCMVVSAVGGVVFGRAIDVSLFTLMFRGHNFGVVVGLPRMSRRAA